MSAPAPELNEYSTRLATFTTSQRLNKRRASALKKKNGGLPEWPHQFPSPESLARAGFYYEPASDSEDNTRCFTCHVKLDGWEPEDDPIREHIAHSDNCAWATAISVIRDEDSNQDPEQRDPLSEEMAGARDATFRSGHGWPHEGKKGWKCKISKMVDAGWAWDPNDESEDRDGVTCFYCNLSLDGWEPKDDPFVEHKRREPECPFFLLLEHYHGTEVAGGKAKKGKARGKSTRTSNASKASRMSVQSAMSEVPSMAASLADLGLDGSLAGADDSIVTTATTASKATTTGAAKGKKKAAAKPKAAAKGTRGKKKAAMDEDAMDVNYPELNLSQPEQHLDEQDEVVPAPRKATRKATRVVSKQLDSSVIEISHMEAPPKKATRGRKPKVQPQPEPEPELEPEEIPQTPDADAIVQKRLSEISAQLQDELDHTVDEYDSLDQSTPIAEPPKAKRGVKRTSDGLRKSNSSIFEVDAPAQPVAQPAAKAKRGRKPKQTSTASIDIEQESRLAVEVEDVPMEEEAPEPEPPAKKARGRPKGKKNSSARSSYASQTATTALELEAEPDELASDEKMPKPVVKKARGRPKGSKNSLARSSQASQASQVATREPEARQYEDMSLDEPQLQQEKPKAQPGWPIARQEEPEDLARDEIEIETELERIATEEASHQTSHDAMEIEQEQIDEFETSPSQGRLSKDSAEIQQMEQEIQNENPVERSVANLDSPPRLSLGLEADKGFSFSPNGSDKENQPSQQPSAKQSRPPPVFLSPTKTTRIPLAPGTPNRSPTRMLLSPSKAQISHLTSTTPWNPVDLDTVLLASPQPTPGRVGQQLVDAAGGLSSAEKKMSVEQWVRFRAEQSEGALRRRCEEMVAAFEREGMRGLESLRGIVVSD